MYLSLYSFWSLLALVMRRSQVRLLLSRHCFKILINKFLILKKLHFIHL
ncbi:hypothetical protein UUU_33530 [Klebsiella pneumoniae subsp. pneumoniae DSM 30104 = JCM 1662 = NBRC 14940]|nr:hypothetical protein UUU_33530 [Klebsiella pneumoniae subsp. pneumoniae DSM 30104 = JCM 1662 = NBRC 14940]